MRPPADWPELHAEPVAEVTKVGRWTYAIVIKHGIMQCGPGGGSWYAISRRRAERKARRELARYLARQTPERFIVPAEALP